MLLAEQIAIDCPPRALEDLLRHRPVDWLTPVLRLAGDEGEAAGLAVLGERAEPPDRDPPSGARQHRVEVGEATCEGGTFRAGLHWSTTDYRTLFRELDGTIEVRTLENQSVVGIQATVVCPPPPHSAGPVAFASRRAAECAVRSFLGHLRAAVEASPLTAR